MKNKRRNLVSLFTGFTALASQTSASEDNPVETVNEFDFLNEVETAPLNAGEMPEYLAGHRSHSSHASHGSHRSSSGGTRPTPVPSYPTPAPSEPLAQPSRPKASIPSAEQRKFNQIMSDKEKRKNIILRVQLTLQAMNIYNGNLDGVMGPGTRLAVNTYRLSKGLPIKDTLDLKVLNSLGIAVL